MNLETDGQNRKKQLDVVVKLDQLDVEQLDRCCCQTKLYDIK